MIDYSDRIGDWIITFSGKRFYPLDPRPEDIDIFDIAHSLSLLNRFTGHSRFPYSVAQHCMSVADVVADEYKLSGLLHDASEAYVNDLARPLKGMLPEYKYVENKILDVIDAKFNVTTRCRAVKQVDTRCLVTEATQLCNGESWYLDEPYPPSYDYYVYEQPWQLVQKEFLETYNILRSTHVRA